MILSLFGVLIAISLAFILVGLMKPDNSEMALVGFVFLFLLSFVVLNGTLEYDKGANVTNIYTYDGSGNINSSTQIIAYTTDQFSDSNSHTMGYYMVIISVVGFVGILFGLRSTWKRESERREREQ